MEELPYSNRELNTHFDEIKSSLDRIEEQTKKTNGRVSRLEGWKMYISGALAIITILIIPVVLFMVIQFIGTKTALETTVNKAVTEALQNQVEVVK